MKTTAAAVEERTAPATASVGAPVSRMRARPTEIGRLAADSPRMEHIKAFGDVVAASPRTLQMMARAASIDQGAHMAGRAAFKRGPASPAQGVIQRFADPSTGDEVDIGAIGRDAVEKYLDLIQKKELVVSTAEFRQLSMRRMAYLGDRERIGASNRDLMNAANDPGTGPHYLHRMTVEQQAAIVHTGSDPALGFADPTYFDRLSKFTWRVKPRVSAAAAIRAFIRPTAVTGTVAECQSVLQAVFYHTVLDAVGAARFDAVLGAADRDIATERRLLLQMDFGGENPLGHLLESLLDGAPVSSDAADLHALDGGPSDHLGLDAEERGALKRERDGGLASAPGHRPAKLGGWYYIKNHQFYTERHKGGLWAGENALYVGRNDTGEQLFSGFGLANTTEAGMAQVMADETNAAPSAAHAEALFLVGKFGLALPELGNIGSVDAMVLSAPMIGRINAVWAETHAEDPAVEGEVLAKVRLKLLLGAMELPGPMTAAQILLQFRLGDLAQGIGADVQNLQSGSLRLRKLTLAWNDTQHANGAACVAMTATTTKSGLRVSRSDLIKYYAEQYKLQYHAQEMYAAFLLLNADLPLNVPFAKDQPQTFFFPRPTVYIKRIETGAGFQMLGGKNLSPDKIKQVFGTATLFAG
jgi:hypothetical protein